MRHWISMSFKNDHIILKFDRRKTAYRIYYIYIGNDNIIGEAEFIYRYLPPSMYGS